MTRAKDCNKDNHPHTTSDKESVRRNALDVMDRIMTDSRFAEKFFFVDMYPKMSALAASYNRSFGLEIKPGDVCSAAYLSCWEDNWAKLRAFKGETTPHAWIARLASQATYRFLVDEKYIDEVGNTKACDYRLTIRSISDIELRRAIVDLVFIPDYHKALKLYYVDKSDEATIADAFGSAEKGKGILKIAEKALIEQLLNTENPYAEMALSAKRIVNPEIQWQTWHDRIDEGDVDDNHQSLRELLCQLYHNEDWDENAKALIYSIIKDLGWDDVQTEVWLQRFFYDTPSKELAVRFHVRNTWIDNTYSRLNKQFRIAANTWWNHFNK